MPDNSLLTSLISFNGFYWYEAIIITIDILDFWLFMWIKDHGLILKGKDQRNMVIINIHEYKPTERVYLEIVHMPKQLVVRKIQISVFNYVKLLK